jgi:hypothetical protein
MVCDAACRLSQPQLQRVSGRTNRFPSNATIFWIAELQRDFHLWSIPGLRYIT